DHLLHGNGSVRIGFYFSDNSTFFISGGEILLLVNFFGSLMRLRLWRRSISFYLIHNPFLLLHYIHANRFRTVLELGHK
ncbi:hypothetical protein PFISCL1PPCAC_1022, partial [Pristionchus fissidentatus]